MAFGLFWMVVPHVAVVCSLLLASSNPNTWEAMTCLDEIKASAQLSSASNNVSLMQQNAKDASQSARTVLQKHKSLFTHIKKSYGFVFNPVYESPYKPAWPWRCGTLKARWISQLIRETPNLIALKDEVLYITGSQWMFSICCPTLLLLLVPSLLGGMVRWVF